MSNRTCGSCKSFYRDSTYDKETDEGFCKYYYHPTMRHNSFCTGAIVNCVQWEEKQPATNCPCYESGEALTGTLRKGE